MKNTNNQQIKLPKLPYGEGSMSIRPDGTIMYRKRIGNPKVSSKLTFLKSRTTLSAIF